jgi:filamentous hemagglutinin family protein
MFNHIYRLIWSHALQAWVVVSEITRGRGKQSGSLTVAARSVTVVILLLLIPYAHAGPEGGQVVSGSGSISASGATTTINQTSDKLSLNWQSFNVAKAETVNFVQPSASALAVNRIFDTQGSQILGKINANGQVWLINPNGVLFGRDAQINVGGLLASTLNPDDASIGSSRSNFSGNSTASVVNLGSINTTQGGYVAMLGHSVSNSGQINAPGGTVAMGAGSAVSLNFAGSSLLGLEVTSNQVNALAENGGLIRSDGGQVLLTAGARESLLASVVNSTGVIRADTAFEQNGKIVLSGGGSGVVSVTGTLAAAGAGPGLKGGKVSVLGSKVGLSGDALIDVSGDAGGGTALIGGNYLGQGEEQNAQAVFVGANTRINADATAQGDGGKVIVWSDETTRFLGSISARGGSAGGNGGFVETSGKEYLLAEGRVDASAAKGEAGVWLLDPSNVTISTATSNGSYISAVFTPGIGSATVNRDAIEASLNGGTSVTINTNSSGSQPGNITIAASITKSSGGAASLTLNAANNISVNNIVSSTSNGNALSVFLNATNVTTFSAATQSSPGGSLSTNGGDVSITGTGAKTLGNINTKNINDTDTYGTGNLTIGSRGAISQLGSTALTIKGTTTLEAGTGNDITLENANNNFTGAVSLTSGKIVKLRDADDLELGTSTVNSNLLITTNGALTQSMGTTLTVTGTGTTTLIAGVVNDAKDITLDNPGNNFTGAVSVTRGKDVKLRDDTGTLTLGSSTVSGTLDITAVGTVSQSGTVNAAQLTATLTGDSSALNLNALPNKIEKLNAIIAPGGFKLTNGDNSVIVAGNITATGTNSAVAINAGAGTYTQDTDVDINAGAGNITITADTVAIAANSDNNAFKTTGTLTLKPKTQGQAMSLAGSSAFDLSTAEITAIATGATGPIVIGDTASKGVLTIGGAVSLAGKTLTLNAGSITDDDTTTRTITAETVNLRANSGTIGSSNTNGSIDIVATNLSVYASNPNGNADAFVSATGDIIMAGGPDGAGSSVGTTGTLDLTATTGSVTQSGTGKITANTLNVKTLAAGGAAIDLDDAANEVNKVNLQTRNGAAISYKDATGFEITGINNDSDTSGNVALLAGGNVTQTGVVKAAQLTADFSAGALTLDGPGNNIVQLNTIITPGGFTLKNGNNDVNYDVTLAGNITAATDRTVFIEAGSITDTGVRTITAGTVNLKANKAKIDGGKIGSSDNGIDIDAKNLSVNTNNADAFVRTLDDIKMDGGPDGNGSNLGTGTLDLTATGDGTEDASGKVTQSGTGKITADTLYVRTLVVADQEINLTTAANEVKKVNLQILGGVIKYKAAKGFEIIGINNVENAGGRVTLEAGDTVTQSGAVKAAQLTANLSAGALTLDRSDNKIDQLNAITAPGGFTLINGNNRVDINGAITSTDNPITINTGTSLTIFGDDGSIKSGGGNVTLTNTHAEKVLGSIDTTGGESDGNFTINGEGSIDQTGSTALIIKGKTSIAAGKDNDVMLDNAGNDFRGAVSVTSGKDLKLVDTDDLDLGRSEISDELNVKTGKLLKQSGALVVNGETRLEAGTDITLDNSLNDFKNTVFVTKGTKVILANSGNLKLGATTVTGTLTIDAGGEVTQTGAIKATGLALIGTNADYRLNHADNAVTTLAANTRSVNYLQSGALVVGTVDGTSGVETSGTTQIETTGAGANLTLDEVVESDATGNAIILKAGSSNAAGVSTGGQLINNVGRDGIKASKGRYLVYSGDPGSPEEDVTKEGVTGYAKRYNTGASFDPKGTTASTFFYRIAPELKVTANKGSKDYDGVEPNLTFEADGLIDGDTAGMALTGTLSRAGGKNVLGGDEVEIGTLAAQMGYQITSYKEAIYTINKANLTEVTASKTDDGLNTVTWGQMTAIKGVYNESFKATDGKATFSEETLTNLSGLELTGVNGGNRNNYNLDSGLPAAGDKNRVVIIAKATTSTQSVSNVPLPPVINAPPLQSDTRFVIAASPAQNTQSFNWSFFFNRLFQEDDGRADNLVNQGPQGSELNLSEKLPD